MEGIREVERSGTDADLELVRAGIRRIAGSLVPWITKALNIEHGDWRYYLVDSDDDDIDDDDTCMQEQCRDRYTVDDIGFSNSADRTHEIYFDLNDDEHGHGRKDIIGHIIPARTKPLGMQAGIQQPSSGQTEIEGEYNWNFDAIGDLGYSDTNWDHSAQFLSDNMERQCFWFVLLEEFQIQPNASACGN